MSRRFQKSCNEVLLYGSVSRGRSDWKKQGCLGIFHFDAEGGQWLRWRMGNTRVYSWYWVDYYMEWFCDSPCSNCVKGWVAKKMLKLRWTSFRFGGRTKNKQDPELRFVFQTNLPVFYGRSLDHSIPLVNEEWGDRERREIRGFTNSRTTQRFWIKTNKRQEMSFSAQRKKTYIRRKRVYISDQASMPSRRLKRGRTKNTILQICVNKNECLKMKYKTMRC